MPDTYLSQFMVPRKIRNPEDLFIPFVCVHSTETVRIFCSHRCFCSKAFTLNNKFDLSTVSRWVNLFNILIITLCEKGSKCLRCSWARKPSAGGCSNKVLWLINIHTEIISLKISLVSALKWSFPSLSARHLLAQSRSQFAPWIRWLCGNQ